LGAPKQDGYENYFMWDYRDYRACFYDVDGSSGWDWYIWGYGMWLEDFNSLEGVALPLCATRWTNRMHVIPMCQGGGIYYADQTSILDVHGPGGLWVYKYAATAPRWESVNFARPAGADRFSYDETKVYCVTALSGSGPGSTWTVTDLDGTSTPPDGTSFSGTWGGASVGGFYAVASYSGGVLTLGALAAALPTGWASLSGDDDTCFGKLRWPTAPGILGRAIITATDNHDGTINLSGTGAFTWCQTGDKVNLYNSVMTAKPLLGSDRLARSTPFSVFHSRRVRSVALEAAVLPSGLMATH